MNFGLPEFTETLAQAGEEQTGGLAVADEKAFSVRGTGSGRFWWSKLFKGAFRRRV